jgi:glucans biosynthesis protein C
MSLCAVVFFDLRTPDKSPMKQTQSDRDHAFDALRASMMLLGIVLHAACNYLTVSALDVWPYQDANTSAVADLVVVGIHTFRMPIFFVMAGFFTALLLQRRGASGMMQNRLWRVVVPFALFWVVLQPLVVAAATFANGEKLSGAGLAQVTATLSTSPYWADNTAHLWFLWYLAIFCALTAGGTALVRFIPAQVRGTASAAFRALMEVRVRPLLLAIPMVGVLMLQGGMLQTALSFKPNALVLSGYFLFFAFGLALRYHRELLPTLTRDAWMQLALGVLLVPLNVSAAMKLGPDAPASTRWQAAITGGGVV